MVLGVVMHFYDPSTQEAKAHGLRVLSHPDLVEKQTNNRKVDTYVIHAY
jgi:hypothetical protein